MERLGSSNVSYKTDQWLSTEGSSEGIAELWLDRYYNPKEFEELKSIAISKGFLLVSSSPLTRSSYHADEDFEILQKERIKQTNAQSIS